MTCKNNPVLFLLGFFLLLSEVSFAQEALLFGTVKSKNNIPIEGLSVEYKKTGTITDAEGKYTIELPANKELSIVFSHLSFKTQVHKITLKEGEERNLDLFFDPEVTVISEVELVDDALRTQNITTIQEEHRRHNRPYRGC